MPAASSFKDDEVVVAKIYFAGCEIKLTHMTEAVIAKFLDGLALVYQILAPA
ncbi:MAG TPA: hypothetical protein VNQ56_06575 [Pseudolabrys sp.]|nr:hypothetical protein [Pseudolabrys sp.]